LEASQQVIEQLRQEITAAQMQAMEAAEVCFVLAEHWHSCNPGAHEKNSFFCRAYMHDRTMQTRNLCTIKSGEMNSTFSAGATLPLFAYFILPLLSLWFDVTAWLIRKYTRHSFFFPNNTAASLVAASCPHN
jgi:hypothetical protein